jgi:hypothetical protein
MVMLGIVIAMLQCIIDKALAQTSVIPWVKYMYISMTTQSTALLNIPLRMATLGGDRMQLITGNGFDGVTFRPRPPCCV